MSILLVAAFRLYVAHRAGTTKIPRSITDQATFYRRYYSGDTSAFIRDANGLEKGKGGWVQQSVFSKSAQVNFP